MGIARPDRMSCNAGFVFLLKEPGVACVCADIPDAGILTIGIFAVLAQHELIPGRTNQPRCRSEESIATATDGREGAPEISAENHYRKFGVERVGFFLRLQITKSSRSLTIIWADCSSAS